MIAQLLRGAQPQAARAAPTYAKPRWDAEDEEDTSCAGGDTSSCGVVLNLACAWLNNRSRWRLETAQRRFHPGVRAWQQDGTHRDVWPPVGHGRPDERHGHVQGQA